MFKNTSILLSEIVNGDDEISVLRDCTLQHIGKIPSNVQQRVVPCGSFADITTAASISEIIGIITTQDLAEHVPLSLGAAVAEKPLQKALLLHERLCERDGFHWNSFPSQIHPSAQIHPTAYVAPNDISIGADTIIHPGAIILPRSIIGSRCSIGPGTVIGTDAFEVNINSTPQRIVKQAGGVLLEDDVEIQAKCTIVRATFGGFTKLGAETKLDCQIHVAHDCQLAPRVRIAACAELSGRVTVGEGTFIGPNTSIVNGIEIGSNAQISIGSVVVQDVPDDTKVTGNFAIPHRSFIRHIKNIAKS